MSNAQVNVMRLVPHAGMWTIVYEGAHAKAVREAFGTSQLPTPYTTAISAGRVMTLLRQTNPGVRIESPVPNQDQDPERFDGMG